MIRNQFMTPTFFNIYEDKDSFVEDYSKFISVTLTQEEKENLYMLIASKYGDSNIRYTNAHLFKMNMFQYIKTYYPKVLAFIRDQSRLRDADTIDFQRAGKSVVNVGAHNTANVSTNTESGINQLDSQQISNVIRGELGVLIDRLESYKSGEETKFLNGMNNLFIQIISPQADLLYGSNPNDYIKEDE